MTPDQNDAISKGFATKLGAWGAALLGVAAVLQPLLPSAEGSDAKVYATLATALAGVVVLGRMLQAAAKALAATRATTFLGSPMRGVPAQREQLERLGQEAGRSRHAGSPGPATPEGGP